MARGTTVQGVAATEPPTETVADQGDWSLPPELEQAIQRELAGEGEQEFAAGDVEDVVPPNDTPEDVVQPDAAGEPDPVAEFLRENLPSTPEAIAAFLKTLPEDQREAALAEFKAEAKEQGKVEAEEALGTFQKQQQAQDAVLETSTQAARAMAETFGQYRQTADGQVAFVPGEVDRVFDKLAEALEDDEPDTEVLRRHLGALEALVSGPAVLQKLAMVTEGRRIVGARSAGQEVAKAFGKFDGLFEGGELTDAEKAAFNKAKDEDFAKGTHTRMGVMLDIVVERARADERAKAQAEALKQARAELGVLDRMAELKGLRVAPGTGNGARPTAETSDQLIARWNAGKMTRAEYAEHKRAGRIDDSF